MVLTIHAQIFTGILLCVPEHDLCAGLKTDKEQDIENGDIRVRGTGNLTCHTLPMTDNLADTIASLAAKVTSPE